MSTIVAQHRRRAERVLSAGVDIVFMGRRFTITSKKEHILGLLIATFRLAARAPVAADRSGAGVASPAAESRRVPARFLLRSAGMAAKRETIEPKKGRKRYVRRDTEGQFTSDQTSVGRSLAQDRRRRAKTESTPGQGDKGDRRRRGPLRAGRSRRKR